MPICGFLISTVNWESVFYFTGKKKYISLIKIEKAFGLVVNNIIFRYHRTFLVHNLVLGNIRLTRSTSKDFHGRKKSHRNGNWKHDQQQIGNTIVIFLYINLNTRVKNSLNRLIQHVMQHVLDYLNIKQASIIYLSIIFNLIKFNNIFAVQNVSNKFVILLHYTWDYWFYKNVV